MAPATSEPCPVNGFYYFRKTVQLNELSGDLTLQVAADSNAHVWINGHIVRRKLTRYFERAITTDTIASANARALLHPGQNTVVILLHTWGPIVTFQRSGCVHAGVYVSSSWLSSGSDWKWRPAQEFGPNREQILGVAPGGGTHGDHRIRFAQFVYGQRMPEAAIFSPAYNDAAWSAPTIVRDGPWPADPMPSGTPGQREQPVSPSLLLASGNAIEEHVEADQPKRIEHAMLEAEYKPQGPQAVLLPAGHLPAAGIDIHGRAGETRYLTFDFGRPVHGYPFLTGKASGASPVIDLAYGELNRSLLTGKLMVQASGWLNPEAIVGPGYIDRYYTKEGEQHVEMPDERTARWWTVHLYFPRAGVFHLQQAGFISSQYPVDVKGSFHCGDPRVDQVIQLSLEHAIVSMSDTYVDTPGREDGQWLEDARLRAQLSAQWFGDVKLRQLLLRLAAQSQIADGHLHPFPPSNYPILANADWAAEWVGALYDDYLWTGETARLRAYWPQVTAWWKLVLSKVDTSGLWRDENVFADIRIGVHAHGGESSGIASAQIIQRLELSIQMAKALGETAQAAAWQATHDRMSAAIRRDHVVAASGTVPLHVDDVADPGKPVDQRGYSQAAQAMAIEGGFLTHDEEIADLDYAFTSPEGDPSQGVDRWNNPTYLYRALNALTMSGLADRAAHHLLERFSPYLPGSPHNLSPVLLQGPIGGPLPEYWISREDLSLKPSALNPAQPSDPTGSHGWNAVALVWLHDSLLGVRILEPGGGMLQITPRAAGFKFIEGTTVTPHGPVSVSWHPSALALSIALPGDTKAVVHLPAELLPLERSRTLSIPSQCKPADGGTYLCHGGALRFEALR